MKMAVDILIVLLAGIPLSMLGAAMYVDYYDGIKMANAPKKVDEAIEALR